MPTDTFAEIGQIFDDAQSLSLAGVNAHNKDAIVADLTTAHDAMVKLIDSGAFTDPTAFVHAQKIVNCLNLELDKYIPEYGTNPEAARSTNDVFLDLTDVVTGDPVLAALSHDHKVNGWTPAPATNVPSTPYHDNADQTNFLAGVIAGSNTLGAQAEAIAQNGFDPGQIKGYEADLKTFEANVQSFIETQHGIFEARFDNELEGDFGTIGAAVNGIIKGLDTHNADLVNAGVNVLTANAADVGGNNIPNGGGMYNTAATTVADAAANAKDIGLLPMSETAGVAGNSAPMGGGNGAALGAANTHPVPHGDLIGLLQAMSENADIAGNNTPMGGGNGAAAGAVNTHLIELLHHAMTGTADVAGNNAPMGGENGAAAGAVDMNHVPHGGNGIDQAIGVDHLHHAQTETIGLFHG
jgi:hypothetical protein